jgi:hypothetical protein
MVKRKVFPIPISLWAETYPAAQPAKLFSPCTWPAAGQLGPTAASLSYLVFKPKLNTYSMCDQESSFRTYHTENGYRIINVTIYSIYNMNNVLQMTKSSTQNTAVERHHNSIDTII